MKDFYDNQDDNMRSKITGHEFDIIPGAWEDMEKRLDAINKPAGTALYGAWALIALLIAITAGGIYFYQTNIPFGKTDVPEIAENTEKDISEPGSQISENNILRENNNSETKNKNLSTENNYSSDIKSESTVQDFSNIVTPTPEPEEQNSKKIVPKTENFVKGDFEKLNKKDELKPVVLAEKSEKSEKSPEKEIPVYTKRKVAVIHTFSESFVRDRIEAQNAASKKGLIEKTTVDTPILVLENPYKLPNNSTQFGISAGVNSKVYKNKRLSVAPTVGAFVRKKLASRYAIQADLQYKMFLNRNGNNRQGHRNMFVVVDTDPGHEVFMEERNAKVYEIKSMHLLELPISFIYSLNKKHNVSLGISAAYLFGVKSQNDLINEMTVSQLGFKSFDIGALAGYEYNLNDHISLALSYNVGFLNLARNARKSQESFQQSASTFQTQDNNTSEESCLMPVQVNSNEQIFFENPGNIYNTDLKLLLRYFF